MGVLSSEMWSRGSKRHPEFPRQLYSYSCAVCRMSLHCNLIALVPVTVCCTLITLTVRGVTLTMRF